MAARGGMRGREEEMGGWRRDLGKRGRWGRRRRGGKGGVFIGENGARVRMRFRGLWLLVKKASEIQALEKKREKIIRVLV